MKRFISGITGRESGDGFDDDEWQTGSGGQDDKQAEVTGCWGRLKADNAGLKAVEV